MSLLHGLPLALGTCVASFLDTKSLARLALVSRHDWAVASRTPLQECISLTPQGAIDAVYPPNVRRCMLYFVDHLPLDTRILERWDVIKIIMAPTYAGPLARDLLPAPLRVLQLGGVANAPLDPSVFPPSLRVLGLGPHFNWPVTAASFPAQLEGLHLGPLFNQPLAPGVLPAGLRTLVFGASFNQPLAPGVLPDGLRDLDLGRAFNQPLVPGVLPASLRKLRMSSEYKQPLEQGVFPSGLSALIMNGALFCFVFMARTARGPLSWHAWPDGHKTSRTVHDEHSQTTAHTSC